MGRRSAITVTFEESIGVELGNHLVGIRAAGERELDLDLVRRVVVDRRDLHAALGDRCLDRSDQALRRGTEGNLADHHRLAIPRLDLRSQLDLARPVLIGRDVHQAALLEVGEELEALLLETGDLRLPDLGQVVGQDLGRHAHRDALGAEHQHDGQLGREHDRLFVAPVVGGHELGQRGVEHRLEGELREPALDVARGRGGMARMEVPEISLSLDEIVLVREDDERVTDRGVAMGMELHRVADHVGDLMEATVVHLEERVEDAALDGLETVVEIGDRAVEDEVARVLDEVILHQRLELAHGTLLGRSWLAAGRRGARRNAWEAQRTSVARLSTMKSRRWGVFLPMKKSRLFSTSPIEPTLTCTRRIPSPMNWPNSLGLISPRPLKRVTSAPLIDSMASSRSASE
jgi:hypothetical protein